MVTRKSVAAKAATQTATTGRAAKATRPTAKRAAPAKVAKADGQSRKVESKTGAKTAPVTAKRASSGNGAAAVADKPKKVVTAGNGAAGKSTKVAAGVARKVSARTSKADGADVLTKPAKATKATKPARQAKPAKTTRVTGAAAKGNGAAGVATTRRVIAKRDGETRIVTPEIARIETDVVEQAVTGVVPLPVAPGATRPDFWDQACADLMRRDRILKKLIPQFGPAHLTGRGEPFVTLARSIVGQQISVKAAQAVWDRVVAICPKLTPAQFIKAGHDALAGCGLSRRKAEYILDLATHFKSGALHVDAWASMDDEAVIAELTGIRGIGRWTAEMFLMFNLLRPDVLPLDDVGLINAISVNYFSGEPVTRSEAREVAANWEPWRSVATWYMWRSLEPVPVEY
ncbi:endonuclease III domain-containing protein [Pandoraea sp. PE-S2R-1]|uniref:endonuclease III domain-containing protein n=1 Tax=Pandoraea sp. PE-S2R-1 TaxID=1986994 RepID=UPI000B3F8697